MVWRLPALSAVTALKLKERQLMKQDDGLLSIPAGDSFLNAILRSLYLTVNGQGGR
jgi:hypothetical protein